MRVRIPGILLCVCAAAPAMAESRPSLLDDVLERYLRPRLVVGGDALHLFYQRKKDSQDAVTTCYRRLQPGKRWSEETAYHDDYLTVAYFDGALFVFRTGKYSVYRESDWGTRPWPLAWAPQAACTVGQELWVFGTLRKDGRHRLSAAAVARRNGEGHAYDPSALGAFLELDAAAEDLSAVAVGSSAIVFWQRTVSEASLTAEAGNELWHATFDGERWSTPERLPLPYRNADYAAAEQGGQVWVFCKERGRRITGVRPLMVVHQTAEGWSRAAVVPEARDSRLDWTFGLDAASFRGTLYVVRACWSRLVIHQWKDGEWLPPEALAELPVWVPAARLWIIGNGVGILILLPVVLVCALRSRHRPRQLELPDQVKLQAATWARRVAALLVDALVTQFLSLATITVLSILYGSEQVAQNLLLMAGTHLAVLFTYFLVMEGLTGQSLGKRLLNIVVIGDEGKRASLGRIALRNLVRTVAFVVPAGLLVGSIVLLLTPRSQRLGDVLAHTLVVDVPPARSGPSSDR